MLADIEIFTLMDEIKTLLSVKSPYPSSNISPWKNMFEKEFLETQLKRLEKNLNWSYHKITYVSRKNIQKPKS